MGECVVPRRGGISFDRSDKTALYVRMLGDVIVPRRLVTTDPIPIRRGSVPDNDYKTPAILPNNNIRRTSLQTPTVATIEAPPPVTSALQAKQTEDDGAADRSGKAQHHRTPPSVLLDPFDHTQTQRMLNNIGKWDFHIFNFDKVSRGRSLRLVLSHLFEEYGLTTHFKLDRYRLLKSFELIEEAYYSKSKNPYHNSMHAADVCQAMHCYLQEDKLRQSLTPMEVMAALLASAMHDLDHPGVNQKYMVNSKHHLVDLYQHSVLENHHWRVGISVLKETGVLDHLPPEQWKKFADHIRSLILATDIARQQEFLQDFQNLLARKDLNLKNYETRKFILQIGLKCADICNPCRQWQVTEKWGNLVSEEFFRQGDREKRENLQVSPSCDRLKIAIPQIQCGFIGFVVEPLFKIWARFLPTKLSRTMLHNMKENRQVWTLRRETEQQRAAVVKPQANHSQTTSNSSAIPNPPSETDNRCKAVDAPQGVGNAIKTEDVVEPESKTLKLSVEEEEGERLGKAASNASTLQADNHRPSAIRLGRLQGHTGQDRPHSEVLSPKMQQAYAAPVHRTIDVTLSDSTAISSHSQSADNLRSSGSVTILPTRTASDATKREAMSPNVKKGGRGGSENMLHTGFVGSRRLDSFSLRLPRSPNTMRKNVSYDDPWEKIATSTRSPLDNLGSPVGSPQESLRSPLLQDSQHHLKYSHTSPGLADSNLHRKEVQTSNTIAQLHHGLNNNLDIFGPLDLKSTSHLHHNMSHNKQHDAPEHWSERSGHHIYSEQNSVPKANSKHFVRASRSASTREVILGVSEPRTKATPASLLVRPQEGHGGLRRDGSAPLSPPTSRQTNREVRSSSMRGPRDSSGREGVREVGSPFIRRRMQDRDRKMGQDVPVLTSISLSPRVSPRGLSGMPSTTPGSPPPCQTPASPPPYSVPPALGPLMQDFTSSQLASIAHHKQHMKEGEPPSAPLGLGGSFLADSSPRLVRSKLGRDSRDGAAAGTSTQRHRQDGSTGPAR